MKSGTNWALVAVMGMMVCLVASNFNQAQNAPKAGANSKVAVIDLVKIFDSYQQTEALNKKIHELQTELKIQRDDKMEKIGAERAAMEPLNPNTPAWVAQRKKIRDMIISERVWEMTEQDTLTEEHRRWLKNTYRKIVEEVEKVADKRGVDVVITEDDVDLNEQETKALVQQMINRKVLYARDSVDITGEVLANLNDAFIKAGGEASVQLAR